MPIPSDRFRYCVVNELLKTILSNDDGPNEEDEKYQDGGDTLGQLRWQNQGAGCIAASVRAPMCA